MLRLDITTQPTLLSYNSRNAQLNQRTTRPVVQMETTPAVVETHQPQGVLTIDQTPCRYSIGLKNNSDFSRDNAAFGWQSVMDAIARIAQEGDQLAAIENKTSALADIAANSMISEIPDITWAHIASPEISYQANPVQFNPIAGTLNYTVQPGKIESDYQPASLNIKVTQYPSIKISVVDVEV
ncbi:hypothetical protein Desor_4913 [Desulfosporosinus orientis DSM 765]|uniref:Uncharacterized protein n=1 Tax=Desulfosporosinus orientis (strain ATCC 19365 / DSM 765 / NCIMB 8382 / VKM B-1628 / Singapore I) TaxID=768706 RepID=G7WI17_DESOD|nr:DUF6470 family protein [Desulfosporosinus orientis]AET70314.1 hypothetical protein Desor_4913 [Desulfosporosinus orientis DSM 765]